MIQVGFWIENKRICLCITGHAGQAESGCDIVCASASVLAYTLAQNIYEKEAMLREEPTIRLEKGCAELVCAPFAESFTEMTAIYGAFYKGFELLAQNYPQYVVLDGANAPTNKDSST